MIQVLTYYITQKEAFPRLLFLMIIMSLLTLVMDSDFEPEKIVSIIFMMNIYFFIFAKPYSGSEVDFLESELPLSRSKLWFAKSLVFYLFVMVLGIYSVLYQVYRGELISEAVSSSAEFLAFIYMFLFFAGRWAIFKSRDWKYPLASVVAMLLIVALSIYGNRLVESLFVEENIYKVVFSISFMLLVSFLDFLLSCMKK